MLWAASCPAASPWSLRAWQTEEGLPENAVTGVAQTSEGYLWIATHGGLARFDGIRFQLQFLPVPTLRNNVLIRGLLLGDDKKLWVALEADRGLVIGFSDTATNIYGAADGLPALKPLNMALTPEGALWVSYVDGSVCRLFQGHVTHYGIQEGLSGTGGCWLTTDSGGALWFSKAGNVGVFCKGRFEARFSFSERPSRITGSREGGLWIVSGKHLFQTDGTNKPVLLGELPMDRPGVLPSVLFEDRSGGVWIGTTAGGLFHWDGVKIEAAETSHSDITSLAEDREGNLWVGTEGGGLDRLRNRVLELQGSASGLPFEAARSVCSDLSGRMWAVGVNGALVRRTGEVWETVPEGNGWSGARATCVTSDRTGGVWIGTYHAGLVHWREGRFEMFDSSDGLTGDNVRALLVDSRTNLWIGMEFPGSLQQFHSGQFTSIAQPSGIRTIRAMAEDAAGRIWIGTSDGFLFRVEKELLVDETPHVLQPPRPIRALHADRQGGLWIGYAGAGVGWLRGGRFTCFTTDNGLRDNYISGIESDDGASLWFASSRGIFQMSRRELEAGNDRALAVDYGLNESLPNLQGSYGYSPVTAQSPDGRLWFATRSGLVATSPGRVKLNRIPLVSRVEQLVVDGRPVPFTRDVPVKISPDHRRIEIEYTAFSFAAPEDILFKHKLEGWDEVWSEPTAQRRVSFSRLAAGNYRLRIQARNSAGYWSQAATGLDFYVEPFLWQTWWFRSALAAAVLAVLFFGIRTHERRKVGRQLALLERQQAIERERARIARDIHDELGTGLTQIGLLSDVGSLSPSDEREVQVTFAKIGTRARSAVRSLDEIVWAANPRNDFLPRLADYLCHLADDSFEAGEVRCRKEVPTGLPSIPVTAEIRHNLALAVKEALANTLKHARAHTVRLRLEWAAPKLVITVADDGVGFDLKKKSTSRNGLGNQAARMEEIGGQFQIVSEPGRGTKVEFRIRLETAGR